MSQPLTIQTPFVGRKREQQEYQRLLTKASPWVLIITGQGGNGKSTLLRHLADHTPQDIPAVILNFANESLRTDPLKILAELSWKLAAHCSPHALETFKKTLEDGRQRLSELSKQMSQTILVGDAASLQGAHLSMSGADVNMREQLRQVREMVTEALYAQVLTFQPAHLVLMLDTCEWLSEPEGLEVGQWVMDELLAGVHERLASRHRRCSVVVSSRMQTPFTVIEQQERIVLTLPMLEKPAVDLYLEQIGMLDPALRQYVYDLTYGHALCVSIVGLLWQEQGDHPFTRADLPKLQAQFNERALLELIRKRLDTRLKTPYLELTRYGALLRSFNLPLLQAVFPELLPDAEAFDRFHHLLCYPYVESLGDNQHYIFHDLLRELQAAEVRDQQPGIWREYHKRALEYFTQTAPFSPDWYYHAIAYDEEQGMSDWWEVVQEPRNYGTTYLVSLFQAAYDVALKLTPTQAAHRTFRLGRFYYSSYGVQLDAAQECYQEALSLYRQVGDRLGEANVLQAMGDVQQFRDDREAALQSYEQALTLFRQVGDRLGEANCYLAQGRVVLEQGDLDKALALHTNAYQLYQEIQDGYSQARLLYYRSFVYEAMNKQSLAIQDIETGLIIAERLNLPFIDFVHQRLDALKGASDT